MTFNRWCGNDQPHEPHEYIQHWKKTELPYLTERVVAMFPEEWDVTYQCKGVASRTCPLCNAWLEADIIRIAEKSVFCPNEECDAFAQSFWVER